MKMAYRRKAARKSYSSRSRKTYSRAKPRKSYARKSGGKRVARKSRPRKASHQKITLVIQQAPATPTLATPAAKAPPVRARFGG